MHSSASLRYRGAGSTYLRRSLATTRGCWITTTYTSSFQIAVHLFPSTRLYTLYLLYTYRTHCLPPRLSRIVRAYAEYYVSTSLQISPVHGFPVRYIATCATRTRAAYLCVKVRRATRGAARRTTSAIAVPEDPCWLRTTLDNAICCMCVFMYAVYIHARMLYPPRLSSYLSLSNSPSSLQYIHTHIHPRPSHLISPYLTTSATTPPIPDR